MSKVKLLNGKEVDPFERLSEEDLEQVPVLTEEDYKRIWDESKRVMDEIYRNYHPRYPRF